MWKVLSILILGVCLSVSPGLPLDEYDTQIPGHYLNTFLIEVDNEDTAKRVARDNGFNVMHKIPLLEMYLLEHPEVTGRSKRSADNFVSKLKQDNRVKFAEQQITLKRVKRNHEVIHDKQLEFPLRGITDNSKFYRVPDKFVTRDGIGAVYNDKYFNDQWYLINKGQTGGTEDIDINIEEVWSRGFDGSGVVVSILDDGLDYEHPDLRNNYDPDASADMNDKDDVDNDPTPDKSRRGNSHGTHCAGEIAAEADNGICGVGVAHGAKIGGIRILDGPITDGLEAKALLYHNQHIDIYSSSWGPRDNGATMEGPKKACTDALRKGVETGRDGKGSIYVWATGNGGQNGDMCGADGYVSSPESISVQSLTDKGDIPFFAEWCCSTMISVPTGGEHTREEEIAEKYKIKIVTTDIDGKCVEDFEGTSSAAPLASGVYALLLQANPDLTWRDVQHITAAGARIPKVTDGWTVNGAGYHVNSKFGFGMMDAARMIELAQNWENVPEQHMCETETIEVNRPIQSSDCHKEKIDFDGCHDARINSMEHVQLMVKLESGRRGNVEIFLTSPAGTRSELLSYRPNDNETEDIDFTFMTVHNWGEDSLGEWEVMVCDNPGPSNANQGNVIKLNSLAMRVYGFYDENKKPDGQAWQPSEKELRHTESEEFKRSRDPVIKRAQEAVSRTEEMSKDEKTSAVAIDTILATIGKIFDQRTLDTQHYYSNKHIYNRNYPPERNTNDFGKRGQSLDDLDAMNNGDAEIEETKQEIYQILRALDMDTQVNRDYIESYIQRKRELERKRKLEALIRELSDALDDDQN